MYGRSKIFPLKFTCNIIICYEPDKFCTLKTSLEHSLAPCSYWKSNRLHAIVDCGSAFIEDISKGGMQIVVNYLPHSLNIYGGNIDVSFVLRSKGTLVCNSSSSVFNRTSPFLLVHLLFILYIAQLSNAI